MSVVRFPRDQVAQHLVDPVDVRLARFIAKSMSVPGRHGFEVFFREFMQRGYEIARQRETVTPRQTTIWDKS